MPCRDHDPPRLCAYDLEMLRALAEKRVRVSRLRGSPPFVNGLLTEVDPTGSWFKIDWGSGPCVTLNADHDLVLELEVPLAKGRWLEID